MLQRKDYYTLGMSIRRLLESRRREHFYILQGELVPEVPPNETGKVTPLKSLLGSRT